MDSNIWRKYTCGPIAPIPRGNEGRQGTCRAHSWLVESRHEADVMAAKKVLVGGGSGFLGKAVTGRLEKLGYEVAWIGRKASERCLSWEQVEKEGLPEAEAVIQLAGAPIVDVAWSEARKRELRSSRVATTNLLIREMRKRPPARAFVCASAMGIYPPNSGEEMDESYALSPSAVDSEQYGSEGYENALEQLYKERPFAEALCREWEATARQEIPSVRTSIVRVGLVLGPGGALASMYWPFFLGGGGPLGSGQQAFPWIHIDDVASMMVHAALDGSATSGVINAAAPQYVTQGEFASALGKAMARPAFLPMPAFAVRLLFQERAALLLDDVRMRANFLHETIPDFAFEHKELDEALTEVLANWK